MKKKSTDELVKILWDYNNLKKKVKKADIIITLGSHDIQVAKRGAELYLQGYSPIILFSGGVGRLTPDSWGKSEADIFADTAMKMGVPKENILTENKSTNTGENIRFSMDLLSKKGILPHTVILVHMPCMERRQYATWKKLFPNIKAYVTSPQIPYEEYSLNTGIPKEVLINTVVGDTQRIKFYPDKGFIIHQEISVDVWDAYEELVKRGYTNQLIKE